MATREPLVRLLDGLKVLVVEDNGTNRLIASKMLENLGATVATGRFRTDMQVELVNDGPVTVIVET